MGSTPSLYLNLRHMFLTVSLLCLQICKTLSIALPVTGLDIDLRKSTASCTKDIYWKLRPGWNSASLCRGPLRWIQSDPFFHSHYLQPVEFIDRWALPQTSYSRQITPLRYTAGELSKPKYNTLRSRVLTTLLTKMDVH